MVERMEHALDKAGDKIKRMFSKENSINISDGDSVEIKTALQVRIQGVVKEKDVDFYLVNTWMIYDSKRSQ